MEETLNGIIIKKKLGGTSKSSHTGFILKTESEEIKLRRRGGNPFYDEYFEVYENIPVSVVGIRSANTFLITRIQSIKWTLSFQK